jgi:hypothetical protein
MKTLDRKTLVIFVLGMLTFAFGAVLFTVFVNVKRPEPGMTIENRGEICFWLDEVGDMMASISPEGCFSTSCTHQVQKVGKAVVDKQDFELRFEALFVLAETSRFPLPCIDNCSGGGTIDFNLGMLEVGDYSVWLGDENIGKLLVLSGRPTPRQCLPEQTAEFVIQTELRIHGKGSSPSHFKIT